MTERSSEASPTLFLPRVSTSERADSLAGWSPSPELRRQITLRLQMVAITYSLAFFMADIVAGLLMGQSAHRLESFISWGPTIAKVLDFGLVAHRSAPGAEDEDTRLTMPDMWDEKGLSHQRPEVAAS